MIPEDRFQKLDWEYFYPDNCEPIPLDIPRPRGKYVSTHCFLDSNHAGDKTTRRFMTGILILCIRVPIIWQSKRKNGVETSTFGSEFNAMKKDVDVWVRVQCYEEIFCSDSGVRIQTEDVWGPH